MFKYACLPVLALALAACRTEVAPDPSADPGLRSTPPAGMQRDGDSATWGPRPKPSQEVLRERLTSLQFRVTQEEGTERPYDNEFWDSKQVGLYVDLVSGEPLFSSLDKFDSGTGWPSFTRPVDAEFVQTRTDHKLGYARTEVRSTHGDSHLGHVFEDGPKPTGLRYCINSAALRFVPREDLAREGYGELAQLFE